MLQKNNAFVPGVRPGPQTKDYLDFILNRMTAVSCMYLILICIVPTIVTGQQTRLGGTALLILVSVSIRVMLNIQSFMFADRYETAQKSRGKYKGANRRF